MREGEPKELTVRADDIRALFERREFDPFRDEPDTLWSIIQIPEAGAVVRDLAALRLRIVLPRAAITEETDSIVRRALQRYCAHNVAEAKLALLAWRRSAWWAFFIGLGFFAVSLVATALVQRAGFLPEEFRTLAAETLVIAGWIVMWQPLDDLIQGRRPIRARERAYRAIGAMRLRVEGVD